MLPPTSVTRGRRRLISLIAQRYHSWHASLPKRLVHFAGVQPSRTRGTTAEPSRRAVRTTAGSHIRACESPMRTTTFRLERFPRRQILVLTTELLLRPMQSFDSPYFPSDPLSSPSRGVKGEGIGAPRRAASTAAMTAGSAPLAVDASELPNRSGRTG